MIYGRTMDEVTKDLKLAKATQAQDRVTQMQEFFKKIENEKK